ncbi:dentin sialophosphoprotein-like isoform X2 [Diaphorina citri]|nr:dentin sialophosphoprotein-like isoform X2 [Diaphorina citri]
MTDKDVHDGWCMYEERSAVAGSTSSDSDSIEIISEDEAGNYQIYSKNYFRPDKTVANADSTSCNKDTDNFSPIDTEIKEYSENDPDQLVVEEGKEAHEKSDGDSNEKSENVDPVCDSQKNKRKSKHKKANRKIPQDCEKQLTDSDVLLSDKSDTSSQEISCQLKEKESLGTVSPENIAKESFQTTNESNSSSDFSEIVADETSNELIESFVKEGDSSCENVDIDEIADNKANETEYTVSTDTQAEKDVQLDPEKFPSYQSKFTDHNELPINQKNSQTDDNGFECIRTQSSVNNEETAKAFSDNTFGKENIKDDVNSGADTLSTSSTDEIKACESTIKKPRKRHNIKKVRNENLSILESKKTHVNNIKDKKPKTSTANSLSTLDNEGSVSPQDPLQSPELTDISTLVLISIVGSVIYLIYSSLGYTNPASVLLPSEDKLDDNLGVHDRYIQLVEDWEARVLENAKLGKCISFLLLNLNENFMNVTIFSIH